ncbi:MAG: heme ABC transporter ATP-binding protein CcmA [Candidatus Methylumidiphilus alinenensis]|uniref:Heme ABC transporter ATP-binding protein CcmA n=1 Tax=Candidatus Methylumidiphilus alinenensis TaxID=2202197 RepID=A0A2W4R0X8_9GAMM|nr:MAG: heme ABC transporter ATP-binding protein CcmA [Candidatus Methylumidiphilus alinenensis]
MSPMPLLSVIDLECIRGDNLLFSGLDFKLYEGQLMQVEGANGSGKTSLLRILAGLSLASEGQVLWDGKDIHKQRSFYFSKVAYLGHTLGIKSDLSPLENLKITLALASFPFDETAVYRALEQTGLSGKEDVPARSLSAGQKQRVALARLLACPTKLWIMDEPFTALDASGVSLVRDLLETHLRRGGLVVLTSHQAVEVRGDVVRVNLSEDGLR